MLGRICTCVVGVIMVVLSSSCAKLPESEIEKGLVALEEFRFDGSIPAEFGNLVSVSNSPKTPTWFQLWFQDENGSLRMVYYDRYANVIFPSARLIPRK